ncbi:MAG: N-acetyltransferase [Alphaproteobacteria bacterium]|nr:MAG: N-acetyltransferase [Alphaproteobacteria bacterium]
MHIRALTAPDVNLYRELRLRALQESPTAFSSSYEREAAFPQSEFLKALQPHGDSVNRIFGAFDEENNQLVGILRFTRENGVKRAHIGGLWSMYVAPEYRGQHIGASLLDEALNRAQTLGLRQVLLSVNAENTVARRLYVARGFERYGLEPDALLIGGRYYDEEHMIRRFKVGI